MVQDLTQDISLKGLYYHFFFQFFFYRHNKISTYGICFMMIVLYYQSKTPIGFWYRQGTNLKFLIWQQETLLVELIRTHML